MSLGTLYLCVKKTKSCIKKYIAISTLSLFTKLAILGERGIRKMYGKGKGSTVPSDNQAREKLALYVYEYLIHVGASKAAQTFLNEIRWDKQINLCEPPGFLHSWWW